MSFEHIKTSFKLISLYLLFSFLGLYFITLAMIANQDLIKLGSDPINAVFSASKIAFSLFLMSLSIIQLKYFVLRFLIFGLGLLILFF